MVVVPDVVVLEAAVVDVVRDVDVEADVDSSPVELEPPFVDVEPLDMFADPSTMVVKSVVAAES